MHVSMILVSFDACMDEFACTYMCYYDYGLNSSLYYIFCDFELQGLMKTKKGNSGHSLPCACTRQRN